jgi:hypothetical protein
MEAVQDQLKERGVEGVIFEPAFSDPKLRSKL